MKKILITLLLLSISLFVVTQKTYALSNLPEFDLNDDGYYYFNGSASQNYHYENIEFSNYQFQYAKIDQNGNFLLQWTNLEVKNTASLSIKHGVGHTYATRTLFLNGIQIDSATSGMQSGATLKIRFTSKKAIDTSNLVTIADLPTTTGNPFDDVNGEYGIVRFEYDNNANKLKVEVAYHGFYVFEKFLSSVSFLDEYKNAYYYTKTNQKFIVIFQHDAQPLLDGKIHTWSGFTIWNLNTDEIETINKLRVATYIDYNSLNPQAYFYTPDIPVDDLLSVELQYDYQIEVSTWLGLGSKWEDKQTKYMYLTKDKQSTQTHISQASYDILNYSSAALVAGGVLMAIPGGQIVGIPLLIAGTGGALGSQLITMDAILSDNLDQITRIENPSVELVNKLNAEYSLMFNDDIKVNSANKLYRLDLGSFSGNGHRSVYIDNYKYINISFISKNKIYSLNESQLFQIFHASDINTPPGVVPDLPTDVIPPKDFNDWWIKYQYYVYSVGAIFIVLFGFLLLNNISTPNKKGGRYHASRYPKRNRRY